MKSKIAVIESATDYGSKHPLLLPSLLRTLIAIADRTLLLLVDLHLVVLLRLRFHRTLDQATPLGRRQVFVDIAARRAGVRVDEGTEVRLDILVLRVGGLDALLALLVFLGGILADVEVEDRDSAETVSSMVQLRAKEISRRRGNNLTESVSH